ncbi:multiprotein-bridging factor 1 family protein, partial [Methylobacterium hispanicum]
PAPSPVAPATDNSDREITAAQVRGARSMLNWSAGELARRSGVSASTIQRLETDTRPNVPRPDNLAAIRAALETGGIEFTFEPDAMPGIRPARNARR